MTIKAIDRRKYVTWREIASIYNWSQQRTETFLGKPDARHEGTNMRLWLRSAVVKKLPGNIFRRSNYYTLAEAREMLGMSRKRARYFLGDADERCRRTKMNFYLKERVDKLADTPEMEASRRAFQDAHARIADVAEYREMHAEFGVEQ